MWADVAQLLKYIVKGPTSRAWNRLCMLLYFKVHCPGYILRTWQFWTSPQYFKWRKSIHVYLKQSVIFEYFIQKKRAGAISQVLCFGKGWITEVNNQKHIANNCVCHNNRKWKTSTEENKRENSPHAQSRLLLAKFRQSPTTGLNWREGRGVVIENGKMNHRKCFGQLASL